MVSQYQANEMIRIVICVVAIGHFVGPSALAQENETDDPYLGQGEQMALDQSAVVVLPVVPLSSDPMYSDLAAVVYDELLSQVAAIDGIYIVDPQLVEPYAESSLSPTEIARQLGAATVLQSSVFGDAPRYGIRLKSIDAQTGKQHFGSEFNSNVKWEPQSGKNDSIRDAISRSIETLEQHFFPDRRPEFQHESAKAKATFLDSTLSVEERLKALMKLRPPTTGYPTRYTDGGAALSGAVAIAAAQLATESEDPYVRSAIWRTMAGVGDPNLVLPLVHSLSSDKEARVRTSAATGLAIHVDEPGVRNALEIARANDPDGKVRQAAHFSLSSTEGRREVLRMTAMDVTLSDAERYLALYHLYRLDHDDPIPVDEELAIAMMKLAKTSKDPRTRKLVWFGLGQMGGPEIVKPLVEALTEEPNETVRESVAESLLKVIDEPGVREALANAQSNDSSLLVRKAAERVLRGDVR